MSEPGTEVVAAQGVEKYLDPDNGWREVMDGWVVTDWNVQIDMDFFLSQQAGQQRMTLTIKAVRP